MISSINNNLSDITFAIKKSVYACFLLTLITPSIVQAEITNIQDAVNKAGKQRMLSQRMLRNYALIGMNIEYSNPKGDLVKIIAIFGKNLQELKKFKVNKEVSTALADIERLWLPIKAVLNKAPQKEKMPILHHDMEALLNGCHKATVLITNASGKKSGEIINIAGRQRMLSQSLASLYMIRVWGISDPEFEQRMTKVMDEFRSAQQKLEDTPLSTETIQQKLKSVKKNFYWFEVMGEKKTKKFIPSLIVRSSDKILNEMDEITNQYVENNR